MAAPDSRGPLVPRHEAEAFLEALDGTPPQAVTACVGWTAHEIVAHLTSGAEALANQVEAKLEGRTVPPFGSWEEREPPYQAMDDRLLRTAFEKAEQRMSAAFEAILQLDPEAQFDDVGFGFPVHELVTHMRQEFAIHRWDMVGDDDVSNDLLAQPELLHHSVRMLQQPLLEKGLRQDPHADQPFEIRVRTAEDDLLLHVGGGHQGRLTLTARADSDNVILADPAARLLLLWGRRPLDASRIRSHVGAEQLLRLQTLFSGY